MSTTRRHLAARSRGSTDFVASQALRVLRRTGSPRRALTALGNPRRSRRNEWLQFTRDRHGDYRAAIPVPRFSVVIVCVSNRPAMVENVIENVLRQSGLAEPPEVQFVANSDAFTDAMRDRVQTALSGMCSVKSHRLDEAESLGAGLNVGLRSSDARFVAKFDDDDYYGPHYLADMLRAHAYSGAAVVGKHSYYAHLGASDQMMLRFPYREFRYSRTVAGGTLVFDREKIGEQKFDHTSLGEDRAFVAQVHRRRLTVFAADRFNFVQSRASDNTWKISDTEFSKDCLLIGSGRALKSIDV